MVSEFRKKKLLRGFEFLDADKSGSVEKADFVLAAQKIKEKNGWSDDDAKTKDTQTFLLNLWEGIQKEADTDNDGKVTVDEWIKVWDNFSKNPKPAEWQVKAAEHMFKFYDSNGDGKLTAEKFIGTATAFGRTKEEVESSWKKLSQGKSVLTSDDFFVLYKEYYSSDDPAAPGNALFRPVD